MEEAEEMSGLFLKSVILNTSRRMPPGWIAALREAGVEVCEASAPVRGMTERAGAPETTGKTEETKGKEKVEKIKRLAKDRRENFVKAKLSEPEDTAVLWITDDPALARALVAEEKAVLAVLPGEGREPDPSAGGPEGSEGSLAETGAGDFSGVKYLCENLEELDAVYLDRVYRRYAGIPWDILETERCALRETVEEDVDAFYGIYREPSITRYMEDLFPDRDQEIAYTREYRENVYEFYGFGIWTVRLKETGEVIGRAGLSYREGFDEPELGFVIGLPWQRRGIGEEVCRAVLSFGRKELGFETVIAFAEPENQTSLRLLERLGFTPAGRELLRGREHIQYRAELTSFL